MKDSGRPLLLIDVDGPLNPDRLDPVHALPGYEPHYLKPMQWIKRHRNKPKSYIKPLRVFLNPAHGQNLLKIPCGLVWCTTWGREANDLIGPRIGLPSLPVVDLPFREKVDYRKLGSLCWKIESILGYVKGRPWCWIDDEISDADRNYVSANYSYQSTLLHRVDPGIGLVEKDFEAISQWINELD